MNSSTQHSYSTPENCEEKLLDFLSRPVELTPCSLSYLITEWAAILSLPRGPHRRPELLARIVHALLTSLRSPGRPSDDFTREGAIKYVLSELLDFVLSVEADYALRTPHTPPPLPDPVTYMSTYPLSSHAVPPSRVLPQCRPRAVHAISTWRKHMELLSPTTPDPKAAKAPEQDTCVMKFLDDGNGGPVSARPLGAPVLRFRPPSEGAELAAQAAENRGELCALVGALLPLSQGGKACDYLRRQLMLMTSHDAPIMSCEQYLEVLPKLPMYDRDLFARSLFTQNPALLDLIVLCAENAPRTATRDPGVTTSMALPPLSHTLFSLLASVVALWYGPEKLQPELVECTEKILLALRLCGYLPDPLGRFGEVLGAVPQKAVAGVLKEFLVFVLGSSAEKVSKTDVRIRFNERSYAACRVAMAAAMNTVLDKVSPQFVSFFGRN